MRGRREWRPHRAAAMKRQSGTCPCRRQHEREFQRTLGAAILGIDTLWGGDVMCASGTGRFIADSWFSDEPLPLAYTASRGRAACAQTGGRVGEDAGLAAIDAYLAAVDVPGAIRGAARPAAAPGAARGSTSRASRECFEAMWDLAMEVLGHGEPVPYAALRAGVHRPAAGAVRPRGQARARGRAAGRAGIPFPEPRRTAGSRGRVAEERRDSHGLGQDAGRGGHRLFRPADRAQTWCRTCPRNCAPCRAPTSSSCPSRTPGSPGSMNYLGRARRADGAPGVRGHLRDQRLAPDLRSRVPAAGEPRGRARARDHVRVSCRTCTCAARWASKPPS